MSTLSLNPATEPNVITWGAGMAMNFEGDMEVLLILGNRTLTIPADGVDSFFDKAVPELARTGPMQQMYEMCRDMAKRAAQEIARLSEGLAN